MIVNMKKNPYIIAAVIGLVVVVLGGALFFWMSTRSLLKRSQEFQAVFLTNGQVYFGHVLEENSRHLQLQNVYYLQVRQDIQGETTAETQPDLTLIKLGNELHGPTDEMIINRSHILFIENLKDDSRVVKAIKNKS